MKMIIINIKKKEDEDFYSVFLKDLPNINNILGII